MMATWVRRAPTPELECCLSALRDRDCSTVTVRARRAIRRSRTAAARGHEAASRRHQDRGVDRRRATTAGGKARIRDRRITVQDIAIWHERLGKSADDRGPRLPPRRSAPACRLCGTRSSARCVARPSFLTDEHIASAVALGLRARGIDAATAAEARQLGASDAALLAFARTEGRVLITADPDHLHLHADGTPHAGILFAPRKAGIGILIGGAMLIAEVLSAEEMANRVEFL